MHVDKVLFFVYVQSRTKLHCRISSSELPIDHSQDALGGQCMENSVRASEDERNNRLSTAVNRLREDLRSFIGLSLREDEVSWEEWISILKKEIKQHCWEKKQCDKTDCPAHRNSCGRCWLIAGTLCGDSPIGKFAQKYRSCVECDVYQDAVLSDPVNELYEHLITLVYSLRNSKIELKTLALHDTLTGLHNRNYFEMAMELETKKIRRYGGGFTVFMIDLNNFKHINDTYGHVHGDHILREFAQILGKSIRGADLLIRYGGDEFLVIRHDTSKPGGQGMIRRIKDNFLKWNKEYGSTDYALSFSYGSAVFDKTRDLKSVIGEADTRMYKNKQTTKARITLPVKKQ